LTGIVTSRICQGNARTGDKIASQGINGKGKAGKRNLQKMFLSMSLSLRMNPTNIVYKNTAEPLLKLRRSQKIPKRAGVVAMFKIMSDGTTI
jgi:hypothetical protein